MRWILLLPVSGLLFLGLAVVDWVLYRLEQNEQHQSRFKWFGVTSLTLLLCWGGLTYWPVARGSTLSTLANLPDAVTSRSTLELLRKPVLPELSLVADLLTRTDPPTLSQARAERERLLAARQTLAMHPLDDEETVLILHQIDTLIGVAYQVLGEQWRLSKAGGWTAQAHANSLSLLRRESALWEELQACIDEGGDDCLPKSNRSERALIMRSWKHGIHPHLLDTLRFYEVDPDLAWLPPAELRAARERFALGRAYLVDHPMPAWGAQVSTAANDLFLAAEQALMREEIATAQGRWDSQFMAGTYRPVQVAWDQLFYQAFCALNADQSCTP